MKISTKARYALRAMIELSIHEPGQPVMISTISNNQEISRKYLEALLNLLKKTGLISSIRGKSGGFILNHDPKNITVKDIYEAVEGPIMLVHCTNEKSNCPRRNECVTANLWNETSQKITEIFEKKTLGELAKKYLEKKQTGIIMYYI